MEGYETNSEADFGKLSKINSAGLVNSTLSNLWTDFFRHIRDSRFADANNDLDCIWTILGGERGIEGEDDEEDYQGIQTKIKNLEIPPIMKDEPTLKDIARYALCRKILMEKSLLLRRLQNKQGKGTAYHDGDEEDAE